MMLAASSSQFAYAPCARENGAKYSASSSGRKRKRNDGSVNSNGEDQDVLTGQRFVDPGEREALGFDFHLRLLNAHLVLELDRDGGILLAVLEEDESPAGLQRGSQLLQHRLRLRQLVVHIHHQLEVD